MPVADGAVVVPAAALDGSALSHFFVTGSRGRVAASSVAFATRRSLLTRVAIAAASFLRARRDVQVTTRQLRPARHATPGSDQSVTAGVGDMGRAEGRRPATAGEPFHVGSADPTRLADQIPKAPGAELGGEARGGDWRAERAGAGGAATGGREMETPRLQVAGPAAPRAADRQELDAVPAVWGDAVDDVPAELAGSAAVRARDRGDHPSGSSWSSSRCRR